jgi:hypothetical protein
VAISERLNVTLLSILLPSGFLYSTTGPVGKMKTYVGTLLCFTAFAAAAPAPQVTSSPASFPAPPQRSSEVTGATSHGPYNGPAPTVTGALSAPAAALSAAPGGLPPVTYTNNNGLLQAGYEPVPYQPAGGQGTNGTLPYYHPLSDFDYESLTLALYQEWIELDLFHNGLARFSVADFEAAGLTAEDRFLIQFMADQEIGHATLLSNILGPAVRCPQSSDTLLLTQELGTSAMHIQLPFHER